MSVPLVLVGMVVRVTVCIAIWRRDGFRATREDDVSVR